MPFSPAEQESACLLLFTKRAEPGRVKTRLIGELTAEQAAELQTAFLEDLEERMSRGRFELRLAWALEPGEPLPESSIVGLRQTGANLGERLFAGLEQTAEGFDSVAAIGSDHPEIPLSLVHQAFDKLASGTDVVLGPASDGGYYLIAVNRGTLRPEIFRDIPWSSSKVLATTLERCRELGLKVELLPAGYDVDTPADLVRLSNHLQRDSDLDCPRTREVLRTWGRL